MKFLPTLATLLIRLLAATMRVTRVDEGSILHHPDHPPYVLCFWHNRTLLMTRFYEKYCRGRTALVFISRSRDGQFITDVAAGFGLRAARGSSSRHGVSAALSALREANDARVDLVLTPDGPRGPCYVLQPGLVRLAQATGRAIVAIDCEIKWKLRLKSWDRFQVPLPFSPCRLITSEPIHVPADLDEAGLAAVSRRVAAALGGG